MHTLDFKEVSRFLGEKSSVKYNPFQYWEDRSKDFPLLTSLALKFLTIPASSAESERLFSVTSRILSEKRKSLTPERLGTLSFLAHNFKLLK